MIGIIPYQRDRKIISKAAVHEVSLARSIVQLKLFSSFEDLEDQLLIVTAALAGEILDRFHAGRLDRLEAELGIGFLDHGNAVIAQFHFIRHDISHTGDRFFLKRHHLSFLI